MKKITAYERVRVAMAVSDLQYELISAKMDYKMWASCVARIEEEMLYPSKDPRSVVRAALGSIAAIPAAEFGSSWWLGGAMFRVDRIERELSLEPCQRNIGLTELDDAGLNRVHQIHDRAEREFSDMKERAA